MKNILSKSNKYSTLFLAILTLHGLTRTFYRIDLDNLTIWLSILCVTIFLIYINLLKSLVFSTLTLIVAVVSISYFKIDLFYSTASWNYLAIGYHAATNSPSINYYGDADSYSANFNIVEFIFGKLIGLVSNPNGFEYISVYRIANSFLVGVGAIIIILIGKKNYILSMIAVAVAVEGVFSPYLKHNLGFLSAIMFFGYFLKLPSNKFLGLSSALVLVALFSVCLISTETYPLFILAGLGIYILVFSNKNLSLWLFYSFIGLETVLVMFTIYGYGDGNTFSADLNLNYSYILHSVYGHPIKFWIGVVLYASSIFFAFGKVVSRRCDCSKVIFSLYLGCLVCLILSLIVPQLSAYAVTFHRSVYLGLILILIYLISLDWHQLPRHLSKVAFGTLVISSNLINNVSHIILNNYSLQNFSYDSVINPLSGELLSFEFIMDTSNFIKPFDTVYLNENFAGHSILSYWYSARPVVLFPGLISNIDPNLYVLGKQRESFILDVNRTSQLSDIALDYAIFDRSQNCNDLGFEEVLTTYDQWQLCRVGSDNFDE